MKNLFFFFFLVTLFGCQHKQVNNAANSEYIDKQIAERVALLNKNQDSLSINVNKITSEVDKLILLSKDVENIDASINQSNNYFEEAQKNYALDSISYFKLYKEMPLDDIVGFTII